MFKQLRALFTLTPLVIYVVTLSVASSVLYAFVPPPTAGVIVQAMDGGGSGGCSRITMVCRNSDGDVWLAGTLGDNPQTRIECPFHQGKETSVATCLDAALLAESRQSQGICEASDLPGFNVTDQDANNNEQDACDCEGDVLASGNCDIVSALEAALNILTGAAGLAIVGGIMFGGYLYMTGRDNPGQIAAARSKIVWALVALLILLFFWAFLQWLIPGGLLGSLGGGF